MVSEAGKQYWIIMGRYNRNRSNKAIREAAIRDMRKIESTNPAILRRIAVFTARSAPPPTGPQFA